MERLANFEVIAGNFLHLALASVPGLLAALLLADWLVGRRVFTSDLFRLTSVLAVALGLVIIDSLFKDLPQALGSIWSRNLVSYPDKGGHIQKHYLTFLSSFEEVLNSHWSHSAGVVFAIAGVGTTFPIRSYVETGRLPFGPLTLLSYYLWGNWAVISVPLGYLLGLLVWRVGVIAFFVARLGVSFRLGIQPNHPDRCGGLKPLGDLCLKTALLLLVPAVYLSVWGFATTFFEAGTEVYEILWSGLFRQWLVVLSILAGLAFVLPLRSIHHQMLDRRAEVDAELDDLAQKIDELSHELRTQAHAIAPQEAAQKLESVEFMKKVYAENARVPTWPVDWPTIRKFTIAQIVPLLTFIGTSTPVINLVESILSSM